MSLSEVLSALMSPNNELRRQAETYYEGQLSNNVIGTVQELLATLANPTVELVARSLCGVLLRQCLQRFSGQMNEEIIRQLRNRILEIYATETNALLLKRLSHIMAQSAAQSNWNDLIPIVLGSAQGRDATVIVALLNFLEILTDYLPDISQHINIISGFLGANITSSDPKIQVATSRTICACIVAIEDESARDSFKPALAMIINILGGALGRGEESDATSIMDHLVTIAQEQPTFFKASLDNIVQAMVQVVSSSDLEFPTRSMALELLVTFTESAPALARRCNGLVQGLVPLAMSLMLEVDEDNAEWALGKYTAEPADENCAVGEEAIERAAAGMGGRLLAGPLLALAQQYATSSNDWKRRRAALSALTRLAEGAPKVFKAYLNNCMPFIYNYIGDGCVRVQFQAIQTIGQFAILYPDIVPTLVTSFMPNLIMILANKEACDRNRGHAACALINLINPEHCDSDLVDMFLIPMLQALVTCFQSAAIEIKTVCFVLLGCVAQISEEKFLPFYQSFMPGIKTILQTALSPELATLRGKAMECVGLLGEAVGPEVFSEDAMEIMQSLLQAMTADDDSAITFDYILPACARISKALRADFTRFLPYVMTPLLAGASQQIKFTMEDADEDDVEGEVIHDEETGNESTVLPVNGVKKRLTMNTHGVQQKNQAAKLLIDFAKNLRGHLHPYLPDCAAALLALVTNRHSSDGRSSASLALVRLFECYVDACWMGAITREKLSEALSAMLGKLLEALRGEINTTSRACAAEALRDILLACACSGRKESLIGVPLNFIVLPDLTTSAAITKELLERCGESLERQKSKQQSSQQQSERVEAEDQQDGEEEEEEEETLTNLVDAIGLLVKLHGESFIPTFDQVVAARFAPFLSGQMPVNLQIVAICMLDDVIEYGGRLGHKYIVPGMQAFHKNLLAEDLVLRQCSVIMHALLCMCLTCVVLQVYGIAQCARASPLLFGESIPRILPELIKLVALEDAQDDDNIGVTDNAVYALGSIVSDAGYRAAEFWSTQPTESPVSLTSITHLWLSNIPLTADDQEEKATMQQLCAWLSSEAALHEILRSHTDNLKQLLRIIADVHISSQDDANTAEDAIVQTMVHMPIVHAEHLTHLKVILSWILQSTPAAVTQAIFQDFAQAQQEMLRNLTN